MGGDDTTAIDAAAEEAVVARLRAHGGDFTLVSEELGELVFGSGGAVRVVVDPIDGSVNAKRGIPFFSLSLAVAAGRRWGMLVGYVPRGSGGGAGERAPTTVSRGSRDPIESSPRARRRRSSRATPAMEVLPAR
jgi:myo-inositol-1(or 4)-monophosphatase